MVDNTSDGATTMMATMKTMVATGDDGDKAANGNTHNYRTQVLTCMCMADNKSDGAVVTMAMTTATVATGGDKDKDRTQYDQNLHKDWPTASHTKNRRRPANVIPERDTTQLLFA